MVHNQYTLGTTTSESIHKLKDIGVYIDYELKFEEHIGSVPVDFLPPKSRVAHKKENVISILMYKCTFTNMYIKKIISSRLILCRDLTSLLKPYEKSCTRHSEKRENLNSDLNYRTLLTKTTYFLKGGG